MTGKSKNYVILGVLVSGFTLLLVTPANVHGLIVLVSHGGNGDIELCLDSEGYEDVCSDFNLSEYGSPFRYILDVEDPDEGHNFDICYEVKDTDIEGCRDFEFTGSSQQTVNIEIPSTRLPTEGADANNNNDFSLGNGEGTSIISPDTKVPEVLEVPDLPPLPPIPP